MENSWTEKTLKGGMNIKISLKTVYTGIMLVLLYNAVFVKFPYLFIQRIIALILFLMILPNIRFRKKDFFILFLFVVYSIFTMISAFANKDNYIYTHTLVGGAFHILIIFDIFQVMLYALKFRDIEFIIRIFLFLSFVYVLMNDFLVIYYPRLFRYEYLLGNKFSVSYKHIELTVLYCMQKKKSIFLLVGIFILSFYISIKVNCMTGAVGIGTLAVLIFIKSEKLLQKRIFFVSAVGMSVIFPFIYDLLMVIYPVQYFIVNVLNRTTGMTGRTVIFDYLPLILKNHLLLGYGYNTAYEVWIGATDWYPNAQNGFWNCVCEQGIICAVILILISVYVIGLKENCYPLMCVVYVYAILGTVEITMDITFIAWIIMLYLMKRGGKYHKRDNTCIQRRKIYI